MSFLMRLLGIPLGLAYGGAVFAAVHVIPVWLSAFLVVGSFAALIYGLCIQVGLLKEVFRLRRILRAYPWQVYESGLPHSAGARSAHGGRAWVKVPSPDTPNSWVRCHVDRTRRSRWWLERMPSDAGREAKAEIRTVWVVGDPRFRAILAVPGKRGPRRMLELPAGESRGEGLASASPVALTRAAKAGVRLPELAIPAVESGRATMTPAPAPPSGPACSFPATCRSVRLRLLRGAVLLAISPAPFLLLLPGGHQGFHAGKGLGVVLAITVIPAFLRVRTSFTLWRKLRGRATPWRTMDVEIRHRGRALVLVTGNEALRTQLALRRPPAGRAQVWYVGDIYGDGVVSTRRGFRLRSGMSVLNAAHGHDGTVGTQRWGPVG
ncbi:hypothetical protein [Streptomyces sp. NPDC053560]|uniref:hypothetical protein n=1 Tax=Streptomyces sp. NPDC053560 TaxID=3365711 RepID=UPI0037D04C21